MHDVFIEELDPAGTEMQMLMQADGTTDESVCQVETHGQDHKDYKESGGWVFCSLFIIFCE